MSKPLLIKLQHVSKNYGGVIALKNIDFEIVQGEIHCLVGENGSGKSTMIKIISGVEKPSSDSYIEFDGKPFISHHEIDAINKGIVVIYQDLSLFPNLTVAENIALGQIISDHRKIIKESELQKISMDAMQRIGINIPLDALVGNLSIADQQIIAICKALLKDVKLLIMDEPTASLTHREVESLFKVIKEMKGKGITTLFVSHKLNEVFQIADRITVLRDGNVVGVFNKSEVNVDKIAMFMTGMNLKNERFAYLKKSKSPILECNHLYRTNQFTDINFKLFPGEILGITGLLGSGRTELALTLFGLNKLTKGSIILNGVKFDSLSIQKAMGKGIGYVPEDRLSKGVILEQSVGNNIIITTMDKLVSRFLFLDTKKIKKCVNNGIEMLSIKTPSNDSMVKTLSGGNQQKVVLAKWLSIHPKILILDGPTVGIDVAAKQAIHQTIQSLAREGISIILISDEIQEVYRNCNRVLIMRKGKIVKEYETAKIKQEEMQRFVNDDESNNSKDKN